MAHCTFAWSAAADGVTVGYRIRYGTSKGGPYTFVVDVGNVTQYKITALILGVTYYAEVAGLDVNSVPGPFSAEMFGVAIQDDTMGQPAVIENDYQCLASWTITQADPTGSSFMPNMTGKITVQAVGTFGAAGTVQLQGSNDGVTWFVLNSDGPTATAASFTAGTFTDIRQAPRMLRAALTSGGDVTTSVVVTVNIRALRVK